MVPEEINRLLDPVLWAHPRQVCMSYWEHFRLSMHFAAMFLVAAVCAVVHAIIPCLFKTYTSDTLRWGNHKVKTAGCHSNNKQPTESR